MEAHHARGLSQLCLIQQSGRSRLSPAEKLETALRVYSARANSEHGQRPRESARKRNMWMYPEPAKLAKVYCRCCVDGRNEGAAGQGHGLFWNVRTGG